MCAATRQCRAACRAFPPRPRAETFACPTLHTLPRFYLAGESVVNTTGGAAGPGMRGPPGVGRHAAVPRQPARHAPRGGSAAPSAARPECVSTGAAAPALPPPPCGRAGRPWAPSFKDHGWHFAVEPFTGFTIQGHKVRQLPAAGPVLGAPSLGDACGAAAAQQAPPPGSPPRAQRANGPPTVHPSTASPSLPPPQGYQFNQLVQRSDVAYPALWVAPGSGAGPLAASMRLDADFVTGGSWGGDGG